WSQHQNDYDTRYQSRLELQVCPYGVPYHACHGRHGTWHGWDWPWRTWPVKPGTRLVLSKDCAASNDECRMTKHEGMPKPENVPITKKATDLRTLDHSRFLRHFPRYPSRTRICGMRLASFGR